MKTLQISACTLFAIALPAFTQNVDKGVELYESRKYADADKVLRQAVESEPEKGSVRASSLFCTVAMSAVENSIGGSTWGFFSSLVVEPARKATSEPMTSAAVSAATVIFTQPARLFKLGERLNSMMVFFLRFPEVA